MSDRHAGHAGLCEQDHFCPNCEDGGWELCLDLFMHPICGLVACAMEEVYEREQARPFHRRQRATPFATEKYRGKG